MNHLTLIKSFWDKDFPILNQGKSMGMEVQGGWAIWWRSKLAKSRTEISIPFLAPPFFPFDGTIIPFSGFLKLVCKSYKNQTEKDLFKGSYHRANVLI